MGSIISKKKGILSTLGVVAVLMIVGSFFDRQISQAVFNIHSGFGIFFTAFGEYPAMLCCWLGATLLLVRLFKADVLAAETLQS